MMRRLFFATVVLLVVPAIARSQGTISTQGFGYPPGGLSTRSEPPVEGSLSSISPRHGIRRPRWAGDAVVSTSSMNPNSAR
jgi:hypothetical protein